MPADAVRATAALPEPALPQPATPPAGALGRIRLRHLQCFVAIAQLGTLRAAAQAMSVSQPAVTKTLSELEDLLGTRLFVRGRRGAALTPEAERFLPHALASVDALRGPSTASRTGRPKRRCASACCRPSQRSWRRCCTPSAPAAAWSACACTAGAMRS